MEGTKTGPAKNLGRLRASFDGRYGTLTLAASLPMLVSTMSELALHGGRPVRDRPFPSWPVSGVQELELIQQVLRSEQWGGGSELVSRFEELFAHLHNCEHGVAASSGSVALEMALQAAGINRGDEVIVPAHSFVATAAAVARLGAVPVFVDIDAESYNLDCKKAAAAARTATKAIVGPSTPGNSPRARP